MYIVRGAGVCFLKRERVTNETGEFTKVARAGRLRSRCIYAHVKPKVG